MRRAALVLLVTLLPALRTAAAAERVELDNGLTVILAPQRGAPVAAVGAFVRVGSAAEPPRLAGATHFVEHMMFRSTGRRPEGGSEREAWATGARMRAHTTEDLTRFLVVLPSRRLDLALDVLSDALISSAFRPDEVEEERRIVLEETRKRAADPETRAFEDAQAMAFLPHRYGERIIGTPESIARMTRDELFGWFRSRYRPDRTVLVIAGDFDRDEALDRVRRWFGEWTAAGPPPAVPSPPPDGFGRYQESVVRLPDATPVLIAAVAMPGYLDPDYLPSRFLKELLAGWVRERLAGPDGPAVATEVWFSALLDRNLLRIRATLADPGQAGRARDLILALFADLGGEGFPIRGLPDFADNFAAREKLLREDLADFVDVVGRAATAGYYDPPGPPEALAAPDRYSRIDEASLGRMAARLLVPANTRVLIVLPPGAPPPPPREGPAREGAGGFTAAADPPRLPADPEASEPGSARSRARRDDEATVVQLPGGLTLVHLEDDSTPLAGISLVFPSGSRAEPPGLEGLARLAAAALPRAVRPDPADGLPTDLRWRLFALGNRYDSTADRDATRITLAVPAEGTREALLVLGEMVRNVDYSEDAVREARGSLLRDQASARDRISAFTGNLFRAAVLPRGSGEPEGTPESLRRIGRADLLAWHRERLRLQGAWLAVVGNVPPRALRRYVEEAFPGTEAAGPAQAVPRREPPAAPRALAARHPSGRGYLILGARVPGREAGGQGPLALLQQYLGWRIFTEFTDGRSTAYEAGAFHDDFLTDGVLGLYVGTRPEEMDDSEAFLREEVARVAADGPDPALLEDAREAWLGGADLSAQSVSGVALRIAWRGALGLGPGSFEALRAEVAATTGDAVRDAARAFLAPERLTLLRVGETLPK